MTTSRGENFRTREFTASHRLIRLGYTPVWIGEDEIREGLGMTRADPCVDLVFRKPNGIFVLAEVKGVDTDQGIRQLRSTARRLKELFPGILRYEAQLIVNLPNNTKGRLVPVGVGGYMAQYITMTDTYVLVDRNGADVLVDQDTLIKVVFDEQ